MLCPIFEAENITLSHELISAKDMLRPTILASSPHATQRYKKGYVTFSVRLIPKPPLPKKPQTQTNEWVSWFHILIFKKERQKKIILDITYYASSKVWEELNVIITF